MNMEHFRARMKWRYKDQIGEYTEPDRGPDAGSVWRDEDGKLNFFMWEDGNYSCDCNRARFFGLGGPDEDWPCGDEIEISDLEVVLK